MANANSYNYVPTVKGYITDVPEVWFRRSGDHRVFHFDKLTSASASADIQTNEVNAGWSLFPVAYLPGQSTFEIQMTSGEFNADLFAMANATTFVDKAFTYYVTENMEILDGLIGNFTSEQADLKHITINGVAVGVTASGDNSPHKYTTNPITGVKVGEVVEFTYAVNKTTKVAQINNQDTATGDLLLRWPVYAAANDDTISAIKGYYYRHVFKARVTQVPGFDTSYKSAAENSVTFSALDAGRSGGIVYEDAYIETATETVAANLAYDPANGGQGTKASETGKFNEYTAQPQV